MISDVKDLVKFINDKNELFSGNGFFKQNSDVENGIDDSYINNFYISFSDQDESIEFETAGEGSPCTVNYVATYNLRLVAFFTCVDMDLVAQILIKQLREYGNVILRSVNLDATAIYQQETGELLKTDLQIIAINFQMVGAVGFGNCGDKTINCAEVCC